MLYIRAVGIEVQHESACGICGGVGVTTVCQGSLVLCELCLSDHTDRAAPDALEAAQTLPVSLRAPRSGVHRVAASVSAD
jgi:hypothetical protein